MAARFLGLLPLVLLVTLRIYFGGCLALARDTWPLSICLVDSVGFPNVPRIEQLGGN